MAALAARSPRRRSPAKRPLDREHQTGSFSAGRLGAEGAAERAKNDMSRDEYNPNGYGSLGGVGAEGIEDVKTSVAQEGVEFIVSCNSCMKDIKVTAEWPELVIMAYKRQPPQWRAEPAVGAFMPLASCRCGARVPLGVTPDECTKHLNAGINNGKVSQQQIQAWKQQFGL